MVIRSVEDEVPRATVLDAAVLAAKYSKAQSKRVSVSLTRCRNITKPPGAKPGLVQLSGDVKTIKVDMQAEASRLERLEQSLAGPAADTPGIAAQGQEAEEKEEEEEGNHR